MKKDWLYWAKELQAIAQNGLAYSKDPYDIERFEKIREISAEIVETHTNLERSTIEDVFCNETGYQTPKIDTRAAIFQDDKILLVHERDGSWSMPGGWCDWDKTVAENVVKEVKEESGLDVKAKKIIALHHNLKHNKPNSLFSIIKIFVLCEAYGGAFKANLETTEMAYFRLDELPETLAHVKNTQEQIELCYRASKEPQWETGFD